MPYPNADQAYYHGFVATSGTVAANGVLAIPSWGSTTTLGTLATYITGLTFSVGPSQGSIMIGYSSGAGTAPTGSAIVFPATYIPANTSFSPSFQGAFRVPAYTNILITAVSTTTWSVGMTYYMAP